MTVVETPHQAWQIMVTERISSTLSLIGIAFVFTTFFAFSGFQKPINRLLVYASVGNLCSNVATLISNTGNHAGGDSALCQTQGFLVQMFMPADALWTLCMAINVYLAFYHSYEPRQLRALEWRYALACYGIPFIPALVFCFIKNAQQGRFYGPVVIWCWISNSWGYWRLIVFQIPIWLILIAIFVIYINVGIAMRKKQARLRNGQSYSDFQPAITNPFTVGAPTVTTEIKITSEPLENLAAKNPSDTENILRTRPHQVFSPYSIDIDTATDGSGPPGTVNSQSVIKRSQGAVQGYAWCSFLFFLALIVTWVPSGIGRVYYVVHPHEFVFGLHWITAFTLPLQGFWNALIYAATSVTALRNLFGTASFKAPSRRRRLSYRNLDQNKLVQSSSNP